MSVIPCRHCAEIRRHARGYKVRGATHAIHSTFPRCDWHWQFVCSKCGRPRHFNGIAFCAKERGLFCIDCAVEHRTARRPFWGWRYYYRMKCPWDQKWHATLDRLEFDRAHPWQTDVRWRRTRRGMSSGRNLGERWSFRSEPLKRVTEAISRESWDASSRWWAARTTAKGDVNREWVIDPALFRILGDVRDLTILDAGCGSGYLSRLLAERGATVVGVDHAPKLIDIARNEEVREPLGIRFFRADLAKVTALADESFDMIVSNVVMQDVVALDAAFREFRRVLRPEGRLVFSITHPCFDRPVPGAWVTEPPDSERVEDRKGVLLDRYYDRVAIWWGPVGEKAVVGFHRTLEDYAAALRHAGFLIARLDEPTPSPEAVRNMYRQFADYLRVPNFLIVEAVRGPA